MPRSLDATSKDSDAPLRPDFYSDKENLGAEEACVWPKRLVFDRGKESLDAPRGFDRCQSAILSIDGSLRGGGKSIRVLEHVAVHLEHLEIFLKSSGVAGPLAEDGYRQTLLELQRDLISPALLNLDRCIAAVRLQSLWRGHRSRHKLSTWLSRCGFRPALLVLDRCVAAVRLQAFFRGQRSRRKMSTWLSRCGFRMPTPHLLKRQAVVNHTPTFTTTRQGVGTPAPWRALSKVHSAKCPQHVRRSQIETGVTPAASAAPAQVAHSGSSKGPRMLTCYTCGTQHGLASLLIHQKQCIAKRAKIQVRSCTECTLGTCKSSSHKIMLCRRPWHLQIVNRCLLPL